MMTSTKAQAKAEAYAAMVEPWGMEAEIKVEHTEASYYTSGKVMLPGRTTVTLTLRETRAGMWSDTVWAMWSTGDKAPGFRATTRYISGRKYAPLTKDRVFDSERKFANWLAVYKPAEAYAAEYPHLNLGQ
jgi:hypothetical protein